MKLGKHLLYIIYNRVKFHRLGIKFGKNLKVMDCLYIKKSNSSIISIGDNFTFSSGGGYNPISSNIKGYLRLDNNAVLLIGNNCGMSSSVLWVKESMVFGNNVKIGGGTLLMDNDCHSLDYRHRNGSMRGDQGELIDSKNAKSSPIVIEDDVLIGARCIILKGVTIGARSIIGAGSVVSKSIPSDCIAAGNPCKIIKRINKYDQIIV